jgi:MFS family permease
MSQEKVKTHNKGLGWKAWSAIWIAGFAGQLAWNIENSFFNTFVYAKIAPDSHIVTAMVIVSALVSTICTIVMGALSDRIGKRKIFIVAGYILWGVTTILFGCTEFLRSSVDNITFLGLLIVIADAIMSWFGSTGNDTGFNGWTTDITNPTNRGSLGVAVAVQPVVATIVGTVVFGAIIDGFTGLVFGGVVLNYFMLFTIVGVLMILIGISSIFLVEDSPTLRPHKEGTFWQSLKKPFNFKLLKQNKLLIWVLLIFMTFFISFNIYFPHILNFFIYGGGNFTTFEAGVIMAVGLLAAVPFTIIAAKFLNKGKFIPILVMAVCSNIIGLIILSFGQVANYYMPMLMIGIFFLGGGYMCLYQALMVWVKNLYPEDMRSQFEGVRMIFYVCIPMFLGTLVGDFIVQSMGTPITITYPTGDITGFAPSIWLFVVAIFLVCLTFIPIFMAKRQLKIEKDKKELVIQEAEGQ